MFLLREVRLTAKCEVLVLRMFKPITQKAVHNKNSWCGFLFAPHDSHKYGIGQQFPTFFDWGSLGILGHQLQVPIRATIVHIG